MIAVSLRPTLDAFINQAASSASDDNLYAGNVRVLGSDNVRRTLLRFDLTSIPTSAVIVSAVLTLHNNTTTTFSGTQTFWAYHSATNWTSGVNWITYDGTNAWTTAGGDYDVPSGMGPDVYPSDSTDMTSATDDLVFDDVAQLCREAIGSHAGILNLFVIGPETLGTAAYFGAYSVDYADASLRPLLAITYATPESGISWKATTNPADWTS